MHIVKFIRILQFHTQVISFDLNSNFANQFQDKFNMHLKLKINI